MTTPGTDSSVPSVPSVPRDHRNGHRSFTPAERAAYGRAARKATPRSALAGYTAPSDRVDPLDLLARQALTRVPELVPIRYGRMAATPFTFFRGAALPMASDLAARPRTGLDVQLCGDAHLLNFGLFGTPERRLVFDMNDFDETSTGPFEWDVMRLCASLILAARERGDSAALAEKLVLGAAASYREAMAKFAGMSTLDVWYTLFDVDQFLVDLRKVVKPSKGGFTEKSAEKIRRRDSLFAAERTTHVVNGMPRFISNPPLQIPADELDLPVFRHAQGSIAHVVDGLMGQASQYRRTLSPERRHLFDEYRIIDLALRVVGVGSVGTRCFIMLLIGRDAKDPLVLQIKEAEASVLEEFTSKSPFDNHGERVVVGQKLTQSASDLFLGWTRTETVEGGQKDFYLRQFRDWKFSVEVDDLQPDSLLFYAKVCAWAVAKAHARSGDQIAISSYLGTGTAFDKAMLAFAVDYADQTERDHAALLKAIDDGQVDARMGV